MVFKDVLNACLLHARATFSSDVIGREVGEGSVKSLTF